MTSATRWQATVDPDGVTLSFEAPVTGLRLTLADLVALKDGVNLEFLAQPTVSPPAFAADEAPTAGSVNDAEHGRAA